MGLNEASVEVFTNQLKEVVIYQKGPGGTGQTVRLHEQDLQAAIAALQRELAFLASLDE